MLACYEEILEKNKVFFSSQFNAWFQRHLRGLVHRHLYLLDNRDDDPHDRPTIPRASVSTVTGVSEFNFLVNFSYVYGQNRFLEPASPFQRCVYAKMCRDLAPTCIKSPVSELIQA
jgi:hypothetical protein